MKVKATLKEMFHKGKKMILTVGSAIAVGATMVVSSFAAEPDASEAVTAATSVLGSVTAVLNITNVAAILAACMGSATLLFLAWWGVRKVVRVTVAAFSKGKLSI